VHDTKTALALLEDADAQGVSDKAYASHEICSAIAAENMAAVMPSRRSRKI
jgi:hypothetical protein